MGRFHFRPCWPGRATTRPSLSESCRPTNPRNTRPEGRYIVLGAGIASVNEWANILDVGGAVLALTRNPQPDTQDLNVPPMPV